MSERRYVEDTVDEDGFIVPGYTAWDCDCGQWFNAFGQRLRSDWQSNRSNWDEDVSDIDGYEYSFAGEEW